MLVSSQSLLNILIPNNNNTLKEALKEADHKSLNNTSKSSNIDDILKNIIENVKSQTKSNETVVNILKNASVFKNMGNFPQQLNIVINQLPNEGKLQEYKNILQSLQTNIKNLDENTLKENILKSGIFLESKLANSNNYPNINKIQELLSQIKELLKNDSSPKTQQLNALLDKLIHQTPKNITSNITQFQTDIKQVVGLLKEIASQMPNNQAKIAQLTNQLEQITQNSKLGESKITNNLVDSKISATNNTIIKDTTQATNTIKSENTIQTAQSKNETAIQAQNTQQTAILNTKEQPISNENKILNQSKIELPTLQKEITQIIQQSNNTLSQLKNELLNTKNPIFLPILKQIDSLIQNSQELIKQSSIKPTLSFQDIQASMNQNIEGKKLLESLLSLPQIKQAEIENPKVEQSVQKINQLLNNLEIEKNNILNNTAKRQNLQQLNESLKQNLAQLQSQLSSTKIHDGSILNQLIDKLINLKVPFEKTELPPMLKEFLLSQNSSLFSKENSSFSSNLNNLILNLKSTLMQTPSTQDEMPFQLMKNIQKLENLAQNSMPNINQNNPQASIFDKINIDNDVKSTLMLLKEELSSNPKFTETLKNIDRLLTHIDYFQLLSATSNSNFVYLPFIWDMLDEGQIAMKKTKDERYFCEIHLTLKEFGKMDLYLSLYDENSLDITIFSNRDFVKEMIQEHLIDLKRGLNKVKIIPKNIKIMDLKEEDEKEIKQENRYTSYNNDLNFGVSIKV